jgi:hypothetical protein
MEHKKAAHILHGTQKISLHGTHKYVYVLHGTQKAAHILLETKKSCTNSSMNTKKHEFLMEY